MYNATHYKRIQLAIELNSQGVTLIENGKFEAAIPILSEALKASKEDFSSSLVDEDIGIHSKRTSLDECMVSNSADVDQLSTSDGQYVYGSCIQIPSSIKATYYESGIPLVSVAIIFNLALAHHLLAKSMNQSEKLLNTAAKLYELAYALQSEECMENTSFFCLATINNLGSIFKCLDRREDAAICFQHLLSMLMFLVDCGGSKQESEYDGFFRNTSYIFKHEVAAAA